MSAPATRAELARELKRLGFRRDGRERDPITYVATRGRIVVDVQLWRDGQHRASHSVIVRGDLRRRYEDTLPIYFDSIGGLRTAVEYEFTRRKIMSPERRLLFVIAATHQGGHSACGCSIAGQLSVPFPIRMPDLVAAALDEGEHPQTLWPWYSPPAGSAP